MSYSKIGLIGTLYQIVDKCWRNFFLNNKNQSYHSFLKLENSNSRNIFISDNNVYQIKIERNPPHKTKTLFPIGKTLNDKLSHCCVIYNNNDIVGWGWIYNGIKDKNEFEGIKLINKKIYWFGPDYVYPKYRGKGIQKLLIQKRIEFLNKIEKNSFSIITIIGSDNIPSLKSYQKYNFLIKDD